MYFMNIHNDKWAKVGCEFLKMSTVKVLLINFYNYPTRAIVTRGLYIFHPIFLRPFLCFQGGFFRNFCPYVWLVFTSGL